MTIKNNSKSAFISAMVFIYFLDIIPFAKNFAVILYKIALSQLFISVPTIIATLAPVFIYSNLFTPSLVGAFTVLFSSLLCFGITLIGISKISFIERIITIYDKY